MSPVLSPVHSDCRQDGSPSLSFMWPVIFLHRIPTWCFLKYLLGVLKKFLGFSFKSCPWKFSSCRDLPCSGSGRETSSRNVAYILPTFCVCFTYVLHIQAELSFSVPKILPGSEVNLHLQAAPGSTCAVWAVDQTVFLLKPEKELSHSMVSEWIWSNLFSFLCTDKKRGGRKSDRLLHLLRELSLRELKAPTRRIKVFLVWHR